jgi:hypothetical protein
VSSVTCPSCRQPGDVGARMRWFEPRGTWEDSEHPVFRCINCGNGIIVRRRRVIPGARVELIDLDVWGRMEYRWGRENPLPATEVPPTPSPDELVDQLRSVAGSGDHLVYLVAEAAEISEDEARRLLET